MDMMLLFLGIIIAAAFYVITIYNRLIRNRNLVKEGWSGIDVQLKQRANLIPNLVDAVKGYMGHEKSVLEEVTTIRGKCLSPQGVQERANNEGLLGAALGRIFALAENYPDLKASENFQQLQATLTKLEDQIQMARRYYNGTVRDFNILVESFPSNIIANAFTFEKADFFELDNEAERAVPKVSFSQQAE